MRKFLVLLLLISFLPQARQVRAATISYSAPETTMVDDEPTPSPTPTPTPDVELDEKTRAAALAEAEKNRAVSEQEAAEARLAKLKAETTPLGDATKVTIPTGSVTTDEGGFVEVEMLSQEAARAISDRVMKKLCGAKIGEKNIKTLVIYDASEVAALELYSSVSRQLESFLLEFGEKHTQKEGLLRETDLEAAPQKTTDFLGALIAAPGVATGLVKSVAELINLFRTDTEFKNKKVTIPEDMVVSFLISYIDTDTCKQKPVVYYPHFYPPNLVAGAKDSEMVKLLKKIGEAKGTAVEDIKELTKRIEDINTLVAKLKLVKETPAEITKKEEAKKKCGKDKKCIADLQKEIEALNTASQEATQKINQLTNNKPTYFTQIVKDKAHEKWLSQLNRLKSLTQLLIDSADLVATKLNTPDDATKLTAVAQLMRAERLGEILKEDSAFTLRIAVTANGTTKIKKNIFVDAKVRHTAGANLVYQLFDHDGRVVMGNALQFYFDYMSASDVRDTVASNTEEEDKGEKKKEEKDGKKEQKDDTQKKP